MNEMDYKSNKTEQCVYFQRVGIIKAAYTFFIHEGWQIEDVREVSTSPLSASI